MKYLFSLILTLLLLGATTSVMAEVSLDSSSRVSEQKNVTSDISNLNLTKLIEKRDAIVTLISGNIPEKLFTAELFLVDLRNEQAVDLRKEEIEKHLEKNKHDYSEKYAYITKDEIQNASPEKLQKYKKSIEFKIDQLRLEFLEKPLNERTSVLEAEATTQSLAKSSERAEETQIKARELQKEAEKEQRRAILSAENAQSTNSRLIANERAKAEGIRASLAKQKVDLSKRATEIAEENTQRVTKSFELKEMARKALDHSEDATLLYEKVVREVQSARDRFSGALNDLEEEAPIPDYQYPDSLSDQQTDHIEEDKRDLQKAAQDVRTLRKELISLQNETAWNNAQSVAAYAKDLNATRFLLLEKLPPEKRSDILGVGHEGREQFWREITHVKLLIRWGLLSTAPQIQKMIESYQKPKAAIWLTAQAVLLCFILFLSWLVAHYGPNIISNIRTYAALSIRASLIRKFLLSCFTPIGIVWKELVALLTLFGISTIFSQPFSHPLLGLLLSIAISVTCYKFLIKLFYHAIFWLSQTPLGSMSERQKSKTLKSIRLIGKFILYLTIFLNVSEAVLGRGYLYHIAAQFGWLGAIPIGATLIRRWRNDIITSYLSYRPRGSLARAVRKSKTKWYGFFVAIAAFFSVFVAWLITSAQRFALGFEKTRKALAYLFRRRLERRAENNEAEAVTVVLPKDMVDALKTTSISDEKYIVQRFPGIEKFREDVQTWGQSETRIGAWLLVGKTGFGKTSWMNVASSEINFMPVHHVNLCTRVHDFEELEGAILLALGVPPIGKKRDLIEALLNMPRSMVVIDDLQNLVLRSNGGLDVWDKFCHLVERTAHHIYWLGAFSHYSYEFTRWARRGSDVFRTVFHIPKWSEKEVQELLEARTSHSRYHIAYNDLIVRGDELPHSNSSQLVSTAQEYSRLIWDYSEGCPRVAIQCWADSLVPSGGKTLNVRLFERPDERLIESLSETERFVLSSVLWHENISIAEASKSLRYLPIKCEDALRKLAEAGILRECSDGRYRISIKWWPLVIRQLRRRRFIES